MERKPSIHVTQDDLVKVLKKHKVKVNLRELIKDLHSYRLNARKAFFSTSIKIMRAFKDYNEISLELLRQLAYGYYEYRTRNKLPLHAINEEHSDWRYLKLLAKYYIEICEETGFEPADYIPTLYKAIEYFAGRSFTLKTVSKYKNKISVYFNQIATIENDDDQEATVRMFNHYLNRAVAESNINVKLLQTRENYYHMVLAKDTAKKHNVDVEKWVDIQLKMTEWTGEIPEPAALHGVIAEQRFMKYNLKRKK